MQTVILANAVNLTSQPIRAKVFRDEISASGVFIAMDEAVRASQMIPDGMSAAEAANQFCTYVLRNLREPEERANGTPSVWVASLRAPDDGQASGLGTVSWENQSW